MRHFTAAWWLHGACRVHRTSSTTGASARAAQPRRPERIIEFIGPRCARPMQNLLRQRVLEFKKKQHLTGRFMRGMLGGRFFNSGTGRYDGTPSSRTPSQWFRYGRSAAVAEIRRPSPTTRRNADRPGRPPGGRVDASCFEGWSEPEFSWEGRSAARDGAHLPARWGAALMGISPAIRRSSFFEIRPVVGTRAHSLKAKSSWPRHHWLAL